MPRPTKAKETFADAPNRAFFRAQGLQGRSGARLVEKKAVLAPGILERVSGDWMGRRRRSFLGPGGRQHLWFPHSYARMLKGIARAHGAQRNAHWQYTKQKEDQQ